MTISLPTSYDAFETARLEDPDRLRKEYRRTQPTPGIHETDDSLAMQPDGDEAGAHRKFNAPSVCDYDFAIQNAARRQLRLQSLDHLGESND
jgi:hypothetical protein